MFSIIITVSHAVLNVAHRIYERCLSLKLSLKFNEAKQHRKWYCTVVLYPTTSYPSVYVDYLPVCDCSLIQGCIQGENDVYFIQSIHTSANELQFYMSCAPACTMFSKADYYTKHVMNEMHQRQPTFS